MLEKSEYVSTYVFQERGVTAVIAACAGDAVGRISSASGDVVSQPGASRESEPLLNIVDAEGSNKNEGSDSRIEGRLTCSGRGDIVQCVSQGNFLNLNSN